MGLLVFRDGVRKKSKAGAGDLPCFPRPVPSSRPLPRVSKEFVSSKLTSAEVSSVGHAVEND